jgi:hypothetical protein
MEGMPSAENAKSRLLSMFELKQNGNIAYVSKEPSRWASAAVTYGELLQSMISFEKDYPWQSWDTNLVMEIFDHDQLESFSQLKPIAFLNLAAANIKLGGFEGARRCCNAALLFINTPDLLLDDMGAEGIEVAGGNSNDITEDVKLIEPVKRGRGDLGSKALYRRALCIQGMLRERERGSIGSTTTVTVVGTTEGNILSALNSLDIAERVSTSTDTSSSKSLVKQIESLRVEMKEMLENSNSKNKRNKKDKSKSMPNSITPTTTFSVILTKEAVDGMQVNGGMCLKRQGFWSQTVPMTTIYLPLSTLMQADMALLQSNGSQNLQLPENFNKSNLEVRLEMKSEIHVLYNDETVLHSVMEYNMVPLKPTESDNGSASTCTTWTLEALCVDPVSGNARDEISHLVIHVEKSPSLEWYPGCEWWDRVFVDDECIDTTACKVDAGNFSTDLPYEAKLRAEKEHARFIGQTKTEQEKELNLLATQKLDFAEALRIHNEQQEKGRNVVPERGEMIDALRAQLPNIFIGTK